MNFRRLLTPLVLALAFAVPPLAAQVKPTKHTTETVWLSFGVYSDIAPGYSVDLPGPVDGDPRVLAHAGKTTLARTAPRPVTVFPGVKYQIHMWGAQASWDRTDVRIVAPPGYRIQIKSPVLAPAWMAASSYVATPVVGPQGSDHHYAYFILVPDDGTQSIGVGQMSAPGVKGVFTWSAGLGVDTAGRPVGALSMRLGALAASSFSPLAITYEAQTDDAIVVRDSGGALLSVSSPQGAAIFNPITQLGALPGYRIEFGQWTMVPGNPNPVLAPASTLFVQNDNGKLRLTRTEGARSLTWLVSQPGPDPRSWTIEELGLNRTCTYTSSTLPNNDRQEDVVLKDAANVVAGKTRRIYRVFPPTNAEELIQEIAHPDGGTLAATTTYDYYYAPADEGTGNWGRLKSVTRPDGSWTKWTYYGDGTTSAFEHARFGQLKAVLTPWLDESPAAVADATVANSKATQFDYASERGVFTEELASTITTINGVTTGKTLSSFSFGNANAQPIRTETVNAYTSATASISSTRKVYHRTAALDYAGRLYSQTNPDGSQLSAYYTFGGTTTTSTTVSGWSTAVSGAGSQISTMGGYAIEPIYLVPERSTRRIETLVVGAISYQDVVTQIYTTALAWETIDSKSTRFDGPNKVYANDLLRNSTDGTRQWTDGVPVLDTLNDGTLIGYSCDALGRVLWQRKYNAAALTVGDQTFPAQGWLYTHFTYDAAGRVLTERTGFDSAPAGTDLITATRTYDLAGRLTHETNLAGLTTIYDYSQAANRQVTVTLPGGATQITTTYRDGSAKTTTGSAVVASHRAVVRNTDGTITTTSYALRSTETTNPATASRWTRVTTDWAGRPIKEEKPAPPLATPTIFEKQFFYDSAIGRLTKTTETNLAPTLVAYNAWGEAYRTGLDLNANNLLDPASLDRFTETATTFAYDASGIPGWWKVTTSLGYNQDNIGTPFTKGTVKERLTGFTANNSTQVYQQQETRSTDLFGNLTTQTTVVDRAQRLVTTTTDTPDSNISPVSIAYNGLLQSTKNAQGHISRTYYDAYGRVTKQTDPRTDSSDTPRIGYFASGTGQTGQVQWREDSAGKRTNYFYNATDGRLAYTLDPVIGTTRRATRQSYNLRGQVTRTWGDAIYPVEFVFNDYGEQTTMNTFRTGTGWATNAGNGTNGENPWPASPGTADPTTWDYDPASGVLKSKTDADNKSVLYTYNARSQLATRTWARGVITTYRYYGDGSGPINEPKTAEQRAIEYSDTTPNLGYAYNRLGQNTQVADLTGTRLIDHCVCGKVTAETLPAYFGGRKLTYTLSPLSSGVAGRTTGFTLSGASAIGIDFTVTYGYDDTGRFSTFAGGGTSYTYTYETQANLIKTITDASSPAYSETMTYEPDRNLLTSIDAKWGTASKARFAYGHDNLGRRTSVIQSGEIFARYQGSGLVTKWSYNDRSEVIGSQSYYGFNINDVTQPVASRNLSYAFDNIGSRTTSGVDGVTTTYANNALNQIVGRDAPASVSVTGLAPTAANVTAAAPAGATGNLVPTNNAAAVARQGEFFFKTFEYSTATAARWTQQDVASSIGGSASRFTFFPKAKASAWNPFDLLTHQTHFYDLDGNVTADERWVYTWDAENRLTAMETRGRTATTGTYDRSVWDSGVPRQKLTFAYDYLGRRVAKTVAAWNGTSFVPSLERKFIYDGWNLVRELDGTTLATTATHYWGLDLSKTLQDGGGVGGLLATVTASGKILLPAYDGNGNVMAMLDRSNGTVEAAFEYDAFGQTIRATGQSATAATPFRFSTKYTDSETSLLYYGRRYYNPQLGRWLGRDPIEEKGGLHLYGFVGNNGVNKWDFLGMLTMDEAKEALKDGKPGMYLSKWGYWGTGQDYEEGGQSYNEVYAIASGAIPVDPFIVSAGPVGGGGGGLRPPPPQISPSSPAPTFPPPQVPTRPESPSQNSPWEPNKGDCDGLRGQYAKEIGAKAFETKFSSIIDAINASAVQMAMSAGANAFEYANVVIRDNDGWFVIANPWTDGLENSVSTVDQVANFSRIFGNWRNVAVLMHSHPPINPTGNEVFSLPDQYGAWQRAQVLLTPSFNLRTYSQMADGAPDAANPTTNAGREIQGAIPATDLSRLQQCARAGY